MALGLRSWIAPVADLPLLSELYGYEYNALSHIGTSTAQDAGRAALLDVLLAYAVCNDLYNQIGLMVTGADTPTTYENIRSIRNPVSTFVAFYLDNLWTQPQIVEAEQPGVVDAVRQIRKWSNWSHGTTPTHRASIAAFHFALYGEMFIRTNQREKDGRPYHTLIDPRYIDTNDLDLDSRGYVEWLRSDAPVMRRDYETGLLKEMVRVEVWDRKPMAGLNRPDWPTRFRAWEFDRKRELVDRDLRKLRPEWLIDERVYGVEGARGLPVDWIPIAYAAFEVKNENGRGWSPLLAKLEDIDETNRVATRAHQAVAIAAQAAQMLFSERFTKDGRMVPPPTFDQTEDLEIGGIRLVRIPSGFKLADAIPGFDFGGINQSVSDQVEWVRDNLPELRFYDAVQDMLDPSGRAIHYRLAPLLKRPLRARATAEAALILADQHALTLGQMRGHFERGLGDFEDERREHRFRDQPILVRDLSEIIEDIWKLAGQTGAPIQSSAEIAGLSEEAAESLVDPLEERQRAASVERVEFGLEQDRLSTDRLASFRSRVNGGPGGDQT